MAKTKFIYLFLFLLCACSGGYKRYYKPRQVSFVKTNYSQMYGWNYDNHLVSLQTFSRSCDKIMKLKPWQPISNTTSIGGNARQWQNICKALDLRKIKTNKQAKKFYEKWFVPYKLYDEKRNKQGKFTGYYEIFLNGNWKKTRKYKYPVYAAPENLEQLKRKSHMSHAAINRGSLRGKGLEIVWVDNLARLHWMQIQGSGIVKLGKNKYLRVGYAGQNGFDYTSVGPYFKKYGATGIKSGLDMIEWVHKNPSTGRKIIEHNKSYVFFKKVYADGPIGKQGVPLTPERSIAIDNGLYPFGMPVWVETTLPYSRHYADRKYRRLLIAQDKGGAIKGALRADIFFGHGARAEELACYMNNTGEFIVMFPRSVRIPKYYRTK
jgi:membrane-bound lytic murein transglycosylase A